jgi:hypothetical protein
MPSSNDPTDHEWEDLVSMGLGAVILLSPGLVLDEFRVSVMLNAAVVGLVVMAVSEFELSGHTAGGSDKRCRRAVADRLTFCIRIRRCR